MKQSFTICCCAPPPRIIVCANRLNLGAPDSPYMPPPPPPNPPSVLWTHLMCLLLTLCTQDSPYVSLTPPT